MADRLGTPGAAGFLFAPSMEGVEAPDEPVGPFSPSKKTREHQVVDLQPKRCTRDKPD